MLLGEYANPITSVSKLRGGDKIGSFLNNKSGPNTAMKLKEYLLTIFIGSPPGAPE